MQFRILRVRHAVTFPNAYPLGIKNCFGKFTVIFLFNCTPSIFLTRTVTGGCLLHRRRRCLAWTNIVNFSCTHRLLLLRYRSWWHCVQHSSAFIHLRSVFLPFTSDNTFWVHFSHVQVYEMGTIPTIGRSSVCSVQWFTSSPVR